MSRRALTKEEIKNISKVEFEWGRDIGKMMVTVGVLRNCEFMDIARVCLLLKISLMEAGEIKDVIDEYPDFSDEDIAEIIVERRWT